MTDTPNARRLYVDGALAGQLSVNSTMPDGTSVFHVDGGGTANLTGPVTLCSRTDGDANRFFDGSIAQLGTWHTSVHNSLHQSVGGGGGGCGGCGVERTHIYR